MPRRAGRASRKSSSRPGSRRVPEASRRTRTPPAPVFFAGKIDFPLDFSPMPEYSNNAFQMQWRDGRAAKATVCKTGSGGFNSHSRLQFAPSLRWQGFPLIVPCRLFFFSVFSRRAAGSIRSAAKIGQNAAGSIRPAAKLAFFPSFLLFGVEKRPERRYII